MFFTVEKTQSQLKEIHATIRRDVCEIPEFKYLEGAEAEMLRGAERPEFDDRMWPVLQVGSYWGGYDVTAWFRTWVSIPPGWENEKLALRFLVGPRDGGGSTAETMLYVNGDPLQAIDIWHEEAWLPPELLQSGRIFIALKAWSGVLQVPDRRRFKTAQLVLMDPGAEKFYYLANTLLNAAKELDENDMRRVKMLAALEEAFKLVDFVKPKSRAYYDSLLDAQACLRARTAGLQAYDEIRPKVIGVGHAHIDMAWLWRLRHSREKAARTFTTALHLMRQYPEYHFLHSTPQAYKFLKEDYPEIFTRVKEKIESGQWEITGGMWVEADTNLTNGESLVRQLLLGKRYVREEFGREMYLVWMPDVFGYSWALPQILKKSGMKYFLTTKISWSQFNRFPYDTFRWRGIDGTEILTHFVTTPEKGSSIYTYNGQMTPDQVKGIWDVYHQKEINNELLAIYGWGDGGGGPTKEMIESAAGLEGLPGMPCVELGKAEPYMERLEAHIAGKQLPVWDGELYLEYHRGTYTSQAYNKRANRKAEVLYHNAEWLSALAELLSGKPYPAPMLQEGWERILLNQFHDILPGSSIRQVYEDSWLDYEKIFRAGETALEAAQDSLAERLEVQGDGLLLFNPLGWDRSDCVELPYTERLLGKTIINPDVSPGRAQVVTEAGEKKILVEVDHVPSLGYRVFPLVDDRNAELVESELIIKTDYLENVWYRICLNNQGQITSLWDKRREREILPVGERGNVLQAFEDKPMNNDAWDIDIYYQEKMHEIANLVEAVVEETGPVRGTLRLVWRFYDSTITQRLSLYRSSPRIDFRTQVDWHERQVLLKVAFPVSVRSTRATYDIQFGSIERPTHWNTSWDWARFEVVGHKWADLSEGDYGISLLNDCKYGYDVKDNVLRLTLIKSAIHPDETADQGHHVFTYSLLPHVGDWRDGGVSEEAYALNNPLLGIVLPAADPLWGHKIQTQTGLKRSALPTRYSFASIEADHVVIETVKKAEDGEAWIVRLYENKGCRARGVNLTFGQPLRSAVECNLMEEEEQPVSYQGKVLEFSIAPFEIKTFKVWF